MHEAVESIIEEGFELGFVKEHALYVLLKRCVVNLLIPGQSLAAFDEELCPSENRVSFSVKKACLHLEDGFHICLIPPRHPLGGNHLHESVAEGL